MRGLVLEGGGAKGAYEIGACKALKEMGIEFDGVAGTSVGALNGALVAQDDIEEAYDIWYNMDPKKVFTNNDDIQKLIGNFSYNKSEIRETIRKFRKLLGEKGIDVEPLKKIIQEKLKEEKIRESKIVFGIVTVSLSDMKPIEIYLEDIKEGKLKDYLMASAYFPAFRLDRIDGQFYIDGGFYNNLPINLLADKGIKDIIVIRTFGMGVIRKFNYDNLKLKYIKPYEKLSPVMDFSPEKARYNLKLGYLDAKKTMEGLKGFKYYLKDNFGEEYVLENLIKVNKEKLKTISENMGIKNMNENRFLFEILLPKAIEFLDLKENATYEDIYIKALEKLALDSQIDHLKIYDIRELSDMTRDNIDSSREAKLLKSVPGFLSRNSILTKKMKEEILLEIMRLLLGK